jgi:hypothetical protein
VLREEGRRYEERRKDIKEAIEELYLCNHNQI